MDFNLRCNSLDCRAALDRLAVVTTCSHIFCTHCADNLLIKQATSSHHLGAVAPTCPACHTELKNPDDVVKTNLNPTDDYKTSVLSGLSPSLILEIAGRGISFWTYQTTQEIVYQEYLSKTLTEKFNTLSTQLDKVVLEANTEIATLNERLQALAIENETISRKNHELGEALREKSRKQLEIQDRYDKLRRKSLISHVQTAATGSVGRVLNQGLGAPPGSSNGISRLSELSTGAPRQGHQGGDDGASQLPFTERERLTIPRGTGSRERREGSISDGNSESGGRIGASRPRIPMHGRVGSAGAGAWNAGGPRENIDGAATPIYGQSHRQRLGLANGGTSGMNGGYSGVQNWNLTQTKTSTEGPSRRRGFQRQVLNEVSANAGRGLGWSNFG
ncbi:hypothetical protein TWF281_007906 [Arthrobotrys megalospora]